MVPRPGTLRIVSNAPASAPRSATASAFSYRMLVRAGIAARVRIDWRP